MESNLIVAVSHFPILYDTSLEGYRNMEMKNQAWKNVAEIVQEEEQVCRDRWKNLRDVYIKRRKKERDEQRSGAEAVTRTPWKYMTVMGFLAPFVEAQSTSSNMNRRPPQPRNPPAGRNSPHVPSPSHPRSSPSPLNPPAEPVPSNAPTPSPQLNPPAASTSYGAATRPPDLPMQEELTSQDTPPAPAVSEPSQEMNPGPSGTPEFRPPASKRAKTLTSSPPTCSPPLPPQPQAALSSQDEDQVYFLSLLPTFKRLPNSKKDQVKWQICKAVYEAAELGNSTHI